MVLYAIWQEVFWAHAIWGNEKVLYAWFNMPYGKKYSGHMPFGKGSGHIGWQRGSGILGLNNGISSSSQSEAVGFSFLEGVGLADSPSESVDASASAPFRLHSIFPFIVTDCNRSCTGSYVMSRR